MKSVRVISVLAAAIAVAGPVSAVQATNWQGAYVGASAGFASTTWQGDLTKYPGGTTAAFDFPMGTYKSINGGGLIAGGQIGFTKQSGDVVWGIEGDLSHVDADAFGVFATKDFGPGNPSGATKQVFYKHIQTNLDWLGTVRGRVGVLVNPDTLVYGTAGVAVGGTSSHQDVFFDGGVSGDPKLHASGDASATKWGWTVGAGVEKQLGNHWSVKAEYQVADLGRIDYRYIGTHTGYPYNNTPGSVHDTDGFSPELIVQVARVGFNYRFGG
ncbi:MAG: outer membrane beta-barrel protein [Bauldia sp.]